MKTAPISCDIFFYASHQDQYDETLKLIRYEGFRHIDQKFRPNMAVVILRTIMTDGEYDFIISDNEGHSVGLQVCFECFRYFGILRFACRLRHCVTEMRRQEVCGQNDARFC